MHLSRQYRKNPLKQFYDSTHISRKRYRKQRRQKLRMINSFALDILSQAVLEIIRHTKQNDNGSIRGRT